MKQLCIHRTALTIAVAAFLCLPCCYADDSKDNQTPAEEVSDLPEEGSKEWKQKRNIAIQKHTGQEFKDFKPVVNLYKKAKSDRDIEKLNKLSAEIIKKYDALYNGGSVKINGFELTVDDLEKAHIKLGSQRRKMYKDLLAARHRRMSKNNSALGMAKEEDAGPSINEGNIDKIKSYIRLHHEDFADKEDAKYEALEAKMNSPY